MARGKRINVKTVLADPDLRRELMVDTIRATQACEGIEATEEQAERAYYIVTEGEKTAFFDLKRFRRGSGDLDQRHEMFVRALRLAWDYDDANSGKGIRYDVARRDFTIIDMAPLRFAQVAIIASLFHKHVQLGQSWAHVCGGMNSTESDRFIRYRWEVSPSTKRNWIPFSKGGSFSRFYYDLELVIDWTGSGGTYKQVVKDKYGSASRFVKSESYYGRPGITWTEMTSKGLNAKKLPPGSIFNCKGPCAFPKSSEDSEYILSILNSSMAQALMTCLTSRSYGSTYVAQLPIPEVDERARRVVCGTGEQVFQIKTAWDQSNELCSRFTRPWQLRDDIVDLCSTLPVRLDRLAEYEVAEEEYIQNLYAELNDEVYRLYGISDSARQIIEETLGERPPEIIWPQMESKAAEQKRMEHVWRLLSYVVKRVVADADGIVPFMAISGETALLERVHQELAALFPGRDVNQIEVEITNELKRKVKGYKRTNGIREWLEDVFFDYHVALYKHRPIIWHISSKPDRGEAAFAALIHYHKFDKDRMAKLRSRYLREALNVFRREAGFATQAGRTNDRLEWQTRVEEAEALDQRLQWIQEGQHEGAEGGDRDFRILTPWKSAEKRPEGWDPDFDDGVKVNIEPLQRAGVLRRNDLVR